MLFASLFQSKIYNTIFIVTWSQTGTKEFKNLQQISILIKRLHCLVLINKFKFLILETFSRSQFSKVILLLIKALK